MTGGGGMTGLGGARRWWNDRRGWSDRRGWNDRRDFFLVGGIFFQRLRGGMCMVEFCFDDRQVLTCQKTKKK